jgi:hypothetical protein
MARGCPAEVIAPGKHQRLRWEILKTGDGDGVVETRPAPLELAMRRGNGMRGSSAW